MPATDPFAIAQAFIDTLTPGGVPVGGVGAFVRYTPDTHYQGKTPVVLVRAAQNLHGRAMAAGGLTLGKIDRGFVEMVYRDTPPSQTGRTLRVLEQAMEVARNAIVATLDAHNTLSGAVTIAAEETQEMYNPQGPFVEWQGAEWVGWQIRVSYEGTLDS